MGVTLDVLDTKIDGINSRLDKINGTNEKQWDEIAKLKMETITTNGRCKLEHDRMVRLEKAIDNIPDVNKSMWKFALWVGMIITLLSGGTTWAMIKILIK